MLAGNVKVEYSGDVLTFSGDTSSNSVFVQHISSTQIRVTGKRLDGTGSTQINGSPSKVISFDGTKNGMRFSLGAGADYLRIDTANDYLVNMTSLSIMMGSGSDLLYIDDASVYNSTTIATDTDGYTQGNDTVKITDTDLGHTVYFDRHYYSYGTTSIKTGGGTDNVILQNVVARHNLTIDTASSGFYSTADKVTLEDVQCQYKTYHFDQGTIKITTGGGADKINLTRVKADFIEVDAKGGNDTVNFISVLFDNDGSKVNGGAGADTLTRRSNGGDGLGYVNWVNFEYKYT
jgi:hypothetical protein